jgi:hypothetical protein
MTTDTVAAVDLDPAAFLALGNAFSTAKVLLSAVELRLFDLLEETGPADTGRIGAELGLHPRGLPDFLDVLTALGVLIRDDGRYRNSAGASRHLVTGEPGYVGGFLERSNQMLYPSWGRFTDALRTGEPQSAVSDGEPYDTMSHDPVQTESFLRMMDSLNGRIGPLLAEAFPWREVRTAVDVGGARGNLLAALLEAHGHLQGVVFDLPQIEPFFDRHGRARELGDRLAFHAGSFFDDELPSADALVIGHVLHDWAPETRRMIVAKAARALPPGGHLLIYDTMLDDDRRDLTNLVISLHMLLTTVSGGEYTRAEARSYVEDAGLAVVDTVPLGPADTLLVARK